MLTDLALCFSLDKSDSSEPSIWGFLDFFLSNISRSSSKLPFSVSFLGDDDWATEGRELVAKLSEESDFYPCEEGVDLARLYELILAAILSMNYSYADFSDFWSLSDSELSSSEMVLGSLNFLCLILGVGVGVFDSSAKVIT